MQKKEQEKVLIQCICKVGDKRCKNKVLITLKTLDVKDTALQFFKMCYQHRKMFKAKMKEIEQTDENKKLILKNIANNLKGKNNG